jgi:hypothetical protein
LFGNWQRTMAIATALVLPGCIWESFGECEFSSRPLAQGEPVNGVSPDLVVEPLLATHTAALDWTLPQQSTSLAVEVSRTGAARLETADCPGGDVERHFELPAEVRVTSADGVISHVRRLDISLDSQGNIERLEPIAIPLSYEELRAAGLTDPRTISGPSVRFSLHLDAATLAPEDSTIDVVSTVTGTSSIASVDFP